ncbi:MAG TPA: DUF6531 domain-containing protein, partial [Alphaproteobacteria bacterium]|nr:DUF6531 domain-containing protein [Alphaproteobacteria bacterium]
MPLPKKVIFFTIFVISAAAILGTYFWRNQKGSPQAVNFVPKKGTVAVERKIIDASEGGEIIANQTKVDFPAGFSQQDVKVAYHQLTTKSIAANNQIGEMFELNAKTDSGEEVKNFEKPLQIVRELTDADLKDKDPQKLALYFFNTNTKKWEKLPSSYDSEKKQLIATTTHFTTFTVATDDPNQGVTQPAQTSIIDDGDPSPAFTTDGRDLNGQPQLLLQSGVGYNGGSHYTGNSIDNDWRNWSKWSANSLNGEIEVFVTIPDIGAKLTSGAKYTVTHAGGQTAVVVNQNTNKGKIVSLGKFNFNGTGSVYLDDVVPEKGQSFLSYIVFDAVSFGNFDANLDITPPEISRVKSSNVDGGIIFEATVTDQESGVDKVYLIINGESFLMKRKGNTNIFSIKLSKVTGQKIDYSILARDKAGNESEWNSIRGYVKRTTNSSLLGKCDGGPGSLCANNDSQPNQPKTNSQIVGDPVNTVNGNLIEKEALLTISGRPGINLELTYNSQGAQESIFGENWTHSYNYHLLEMDNEDFQGVFVQYPDGKIITFTGPNFIPEPGHYEKLIKNSDGYELTFRDKSKAKFDIDGELVRLEDINGNGLNFTYGTKLPFTLLSQLISIKADGGREITFTYNSNGNVEKITAPENKILNFDYNNNDLTSITDARGGSTKFEYTDHLMAKRITPNGYPSMVNEFNNERQVIHQIANANAARTFTYNNHETKVVDAENKTTIYKFNDKNLLSEIVDAKNTSEKFEYTENKEIKKLTDRNGKVFEYEYDDHGNQTLERDPLGFEIKTTYDLNFNKPFQEINKQADHITKWEYDSKGNVT